MTADGLDFHQLLATSNDDLSDFFEALLKFSKGLFGITVCTVLDTSGFMTTALNK